MAETHHLKKYRHIPVLWNRHHFRLRDPVCCFIKNTKPNVKYIITDFTDENDPKNPNSCSLTEKKSGIIYGGVKLEEIEIIPC